MEDVARYTTPQKFEMSCPPAASALLCATMLLTHDVVDENPDKQTKVSVGIVANPITVPFVVGSYLYQGPLRNILHGFAFHFASRWSQRAHVQGIDRLQYRLRLCSLYWIRSPHQVHYTGAS